jgi:broad specificity phosphatase PhoE
MFEDPDRRRIVLMRHGEAAYVGEDGQPAPDARQVPLTARGREQARAQGEALAEVSFDRAVCSGLPRTVETATLVLEQQRRADAVPELEVAPGFAEVGTVGPRHDPPATAAFLAHAQNPWRDGARPGARFLGGERFVEFDARVNLALAEQLERRDWHTLLLVAHGGTNRSILNHVMGVNWGTLDVEQDNACFNVIDVDCDPATHEPIRFILRSVNVTAYDLVKAGRRLTTMEETARNIAARMGLTG